MTESPSAVIFDPKKIKSLTVSIIPILLFSSISLHWSLRKAFLISPYYALEFFIQMGISFLFSFAFHFSSFFQLFVRPPQTTILPFCTSFSWGWSWLLPPVQCHEPLSIVLQSLKSIGMLYLAHTRHSWGLDWVSNSRFVKKLRNLEHIWKHIYW